MSYKIEVDPKKCTGCGTCPLLCSKTFEMKNGKAIVKEGQERVEKISCEEYAKDACPTDAIKIKKE